VLIGAPGSGKGTQAQLLSAASGARHIATGDLLRREVEEGTQLGRRVEQYLDSGALVPDEILFDLVLPLLTAGPSPHYILDGFPRSCPQAARFDELAGPATAPEQAVLLEVPTDELVRRLLSRAAEQHRSDDTEDVIMRRLRVFDEQTSPLTDYYRADGRLVVLPAGGQVAQVAAALAALVIDSG
jgi:adenylate kinase